MSTPRTVAPRRGLVAGVLIGILVPPVSFLIVLASGGSGGGAGYSVGSGVWAALAFTGTVMTGFDRTRRLGLGILLGFAGVVVAGAGTCTAVVMGGAG